MSAARAVIPRAEWIVIEKADHLGAFTTPEFRSAVLKFLQAHRQ